MWCMCTRYKDICTKKKMFVILVMWRQSTIIHSRHTVWSESHCFLRIFPVMETKNKSKNWFHISTITEYSVVANVHSKKNRFHCLYLIRSVYTYRHVRIGKKLAQTVFFFNSFKRFACSGSEWIIKSKEV